MLVGDASTVHENCHNSEFPWLNKVRDVIGKVAILISSQIHGQPFSPAMNSKLKGNCEKSKSTCFIKSVAVFIIDGDVFIINIKGP